MKDEWVYDAARNLIYRKRDWPTDEEVEELRIEEARQEEWIKQQEKELKRKQEQEEEEGDED
jgi:hypothetical protein